MAWFYLLMAGLLEVAWASGLKNLSEKFSVLMLIMTVVTMAASLAALYAAMRHIPLGISYPLWTGIGSVGSVLIGVVIFKENISATTVLGVILLIAGMALISVKAH